MTEKPAGYHEHHRRKGDRQNPNLRGCDVLYVPPLLHDWIEKHPEEARQLGFSVSRYEDPADVPIVIPESILKKPREKKERPAEKPRNRASVGIAVPKDEREDGAGLLDERIQRGRELLCPVMGWEDNVPAYYVLIAVLDKGLEEIELELQQEALAEEEAALRADYNASGSEGS